MSEDLLPLDDLAQKYFGITVQHARRKAALGILPIPAFRLSHGRKGPLFVRKEDLDKLLADRIAGAKKLNQKMVAVGAA